MPRPKPRYPLPLGSKQVSFGRSQRIKLLNFLLKPTDTAMETGYEGCTSSLGNLRIGRTAKLGT